MRLDHFTEFNGNCAEAFRFYQELFGGTGLFMMTWGESPMAAQTPAEQHDKIIHAHIEIGGQHLMGTDSGSAYTKPQGFRISIEADSTESAERFFKALSEGGEIVMPLAETFWAVRYGIVTDRFGVPWMINHSKPMQA